MAAGSRSPTTPTHPSINASSSRLSGDSDISVWRKREKLRENLRKLWESSSLCDQDFEVVCLFWHAFEGKMVAEAEIVCQQRVPVLDVQYYARGNNIEEVVAISTSLSSSSFESICDPDAVSADSSGSREVRFQF